ncbi:MetQ/NlpA family ABC transporter substrate-binding protein [Providencia stuartii]|uniref:MetQ/NlpA family ABC transporter substrate-binding protein n=2 Tax=Providencia stuartii TaxID=588 RepID=UPI0018C63A7F|nr:MetQ/NlpA family ABC transporter substrate-binding protein [Providencia stuartii]EMD1717780.1 methionine ABC transporter substrate-binding protein [Providencia stuartii]MBG5906300.1 methionine ABC transporter substrate-binding protein [Providencia stuartii]HAU5735576.1 methionine ABC transporter substrate-binding protein [Providencia stuartii]HAU5777073.1 methionine ABC transporter substrate-binding protein [Providencia stuartii]HEM6893121.1 methionine ABC transporter substrate-binding prot
MIILATLFTQGRNIMLKQKIKYLSLIATAVIALTACNDNSEKDNPNKKEITIGFGVGNYIDQVEKGIVPILEKKGYKVNLRQFSQNRQINPAFEEGSIDASVNQSRAYMEAYNKKNNINMVALTDSPSAPQSLRSNKHKSLDEVKDGMIVALSNDPVNAERGARILEELGWIKIKPNISTLTFSVNDIEPAKYRLDIRETDAAQGLRLLDDVDFVVVNGNYVASAGQRIADGLVVENSPLEHRVIVTVMQDNVNSQWAKDLKEAFESKEYADYIRSQSIYDGFIEPQAWANYPKP